MRTPPPPIRFAAVALVAALIGGCGLLPALEPVPAGPLVTVETRGGECFNGPCGGTIAIERDGRVHSLAPAAAELGSIPEPLRVALDQAIRTADFEGLRARPFTGECPVHVDGQETIYTFTTSAEVVRLASCEVEIDPDDPLYRAVDAALAAARPG
jgi:hypothetical protein